MRPLTPDELLGLEEYEEARDDFRGAVIELKARRRLAVGDRVSLVFENRETLRFQVQEMLRVERIREAGDVQQELDVYNALLPRADELSATLFIEITEMVDIKRELDRLVGIDEHVSLVLGEGSQATEHRARFDPDQLEEDRISAVQYVKFPVPPAAAERLADPGCRARIRIDHPHYRAEADLPEAMRHSLLEDLRGGGSPLLDPASWRAGRPRRRVDAARGVRVRRQGDEVLVALEDASLSLLDAPVEVLTRLLEAVRRTARELAPPGGDCTIRCEAGERPACFRLRVRPGA